MKRSFLILMTLLLANTYSRSQVGINAFGIPANSHSMLDVLSSDKGILIPRMTTAERNAIPVNSGNDVGLMVYDKDKQRFYMYNGTAWMPFALEKSSGFVSNNIKNTTVAEGAQTGSAVDIEGDYAIVGSPNDSVGTKHDQGSVQVYRNLSGVWTQVAELTASDGDVNDNFGYAVSISGNYIAVGAIRENSGIPGTGAVYIFFHSGNSWIQQAKIVDNSASDNENFGCSLSLKGNTLAVGAREAMVGNNTGQGAVFIYNRNGVSWVQQTKLTAIDGMSYDRFGSCVDMEGNYVVIGAPYASNTNHTVTNVGAVYFFTNNNNVWTQTRINPSGIYQNQLFGISVSLNQDNLAIGSFNDMNNDVHIFKRINNTWNTYQIISRPVDIGSPDTFGGKVKLNGNSLLVSRSTETVEEMKWAGVVLVYKKNQGGFYSLYKRIKDNDPFYNCLFGSSIGFDGANLIVGSPGANGGSSNYLNGAGKISFISITE